MRGDRLVGVMMSGVSLMAVSAPATAQVADVAAAKEQPAVAVGQTDAGDSAARAAQSSQTPAAATATNQPGQTSDVVVTGSRIVRDGYTAPTPVTVAPTDFLLRTTPSNIPDGLNKLPQFSNSLSPSRSPVNFANSPTHGNILNLRSVGPTRTLILFDGIRVSPTTYLGTVDVDVLPNLLIQRVEVVTGGASAAYGSDAVSGVVNFVLDKEFIGITGVAQAGISDRGDVPNQRVGLAAGTTFAGGAGHILVSGEYYNNEGLVRNKRPLGRNSAAFVGSVIGNGAVVGSAGNPYVRATNVLLTNATQYGKITGTSVAGNPFVNSVFNADGSIRPFQVGAATGSGSTQAIGGDGFSIPSDVTAIAPLKTYQTFGRASYDVTPAITAYVQGLYSHSDVRYTSLANAFGSPNVATIYKGNPFLPAALDAALPAGGSYTIQVYPQDGPKPSTAERTDYWMATGGLSGKIGALKWDASYTHGDSTTRTAQSGLYDIKHAFAALDAVVAPAGNAGGIAAGTITCNVLLNPDAAIRAQYQGCTPINILKGRPDVTTPDGYAYATGTSSYRAVLKQDSFVVNLSGSLFRLPAGTVDFAIGGEYRRQTLRLTSNADPALLAGPTAAATTAIRNAYFAGLRGVPASQLFYYLTNVGVANGSVNVKEGYAEIAVPILKDKSFFQELSINGAGRVTDYSTSGTVETWKAGATWKPVGDLLLRGTVSRDIRAPNLFELFAGNQSALTSINDPVTNTNQTVSLINGGNRALVPETAKTITLGGVISPSFLPGFSLAADYYRLKIKQQIGTLTAQQIVTNCFNLPGAPECALVTRPTPTSFPSGILIAPANTAFLTTRGIDIDASYRRPVMGGTLSLRLYASRLLKYESQQYTGAAVLDFTGISTVSGTPTAYPKLRGTFTADYSIGGFGITVNEQYIGSLTVGIPAATPIVFLDPHVSPVYYTDLTLRYDVPAYNGNVQFFLTINNLTDRDPPFIPSTTAANNLSTNFAVYDTVGRAFVSGVRLKF